MLCCVEGCLREPQVQKGYKRRMCSTHASRKYRKTYKTAFNALIRRMAPKGTGWVDEHGYRRFRINYRKVLEHRLVWELAFGQIPPGWVIHHMDGNKLNNDVANLQCMEKGRHTALHNQERKIC